MPRESSAGLSRRERQIMDILYRLGAATAVHVRAEMHDPPSYSAVRTTLRILEDKGAVRHQERDGRYEYMPVLARAAARKSALRGLVDTFFGGSAGDAAAALLGQPGRMTSTELDRLQQLIEKARSEAR